MENHPIPQDVTGFKFKIIGSITVKQFGYLLLAGVICLIIFLLPLPTLLKIPFFGMTVLLALGLAFVPIEGRPMDKMIVNFAKALPAENQYVYRKQGVNLAEYEIFKPIKTTTQKTTQQSSQDAVRRSELASALRNSSFRPDSEEMDFFNKMKADFDAAPASSNPAVKPVQPSLVAQVKPQPFPIQQPVKEVAQPVVKSPIPVDTPIPSINQVLPNSATEQKPEESQKPAIPFPTAAPIQAQKLEDSTNTKSINKNHLSAGFPILPDIPNVVLGILKDPRGKVLPKILVEILDKNDIPVRAFKTNALGQFASATPLPNGTYKILFEDQEKKHEFETIEITLNGDKVFQPLEITSIDDREKLRRELFGGAGAQSSAPSI